MDFSELLLKRLDPLLDQNDVLDYSRFIRFQVIICSCEYITVLSEQADKRFPLFWCATLTKIYKLQISFCSQVNLFMHQYRTMDFGVPGSFEVVLQMIKLLE